jgi:hypothetical protein
VISDCVISDCTDEPLGFWCSCFLVIGIDSYVIYIQE